jgi:5'-3' exonuclease
VVAHGATVVGIRQHDTVAHQQPARLLSLDSASLYYRAFYGIPDSVKAPDGTPVNAVRGFMDMVSRLILDRRPHAVAAAWDEDWRPAFRVDVLASYKAHRVEHAVSDGPDDEQTPDTLRPQVDIIRDVLDAIGLRPIGCVGFEADDVLGTLAHHLGSDPLPLQELEIVTGDRDLFQLVDDRRGIRVLYTAKGVSRYETITEVQIAERYGIPGRSYAAYAALRGDSSDGLPGVRGIGDKTAATIVTRFPTLDLIRSAMDDPHAELAPPVRAKLLAGRDYLSVIDPVVTVAPDCPLDLSAVLATPAINDEWTDALATQWGLGSSMTRLVSAVRSLR